MGIYQVIKEPELYEVAEADVWQGAMVLGHSLRDHGTKKQLVAFVTLDSLHTSTLDELKVWEITTTIVDLTNGLLYQEGLWSAYPR